MHCRGGGAALCCPSVTYEKPYSWEWYSWLLRTGKKCGKGIRKYVKRKVKDFLL